MNCGAIWRIKGVDGDAVEQRQETLNFIKNARVFNEKFNGTKIEIQAMLKSKHFPLVSYEPA